MSQRPLEVVVFSALLAASALFMMFLGEMAHAYYAPALCLALVAILLWSARAPKLFKVLLLLNQLTAIVLILAIAYRRAVQPAETLTLDISSLALIGNMLFGGPVLAILSVPLLALLARGKRLPAWLASRAA